MDARAGPANTRRSLFLFTSPLLNYYLILMPVPVNERFGHSLNYQPTAARFTSMQFGFKQW
jgi:hypothetical protein